MPAKMMSRFSLLRRQFQSNKAIGKIKPRVVIVGAGWAGYRVASDLDKNKYDVVVISPRNHFLFTPLLPSTAVGTIEFRAIQEPVRKIPNLDYYQAIVESVDFQKGQLYCADAFKTDAHKFTLDYDALVLAPGSEANTFGVPGVESNESVFFLKQLQDARMIRNRLIECFERASSPSVDAEEMQRLLTFVVVGGGPTSVEFTAELHDFLKEDVTRLYPQLWKHCRVFIVEASGSILGSFNRSLSSYVESLFKKREITVLTKTQVKSVNEHTVYFEDGQSMDFGLMVWSTGIKQTDLVSSFDSVVVSRSKQQRLLVDDYLRVLAPVKDGETHTPPHPVQSTKAVFALGDCAGHFQKPLPALAQVASQQAIYIAKVLNKEGIEAVWSKGASRPFIYNHLGSMASVGQWKGVYDSAALGESEGVIPGIRGFLAFALWRAAYLTRQVSLTNKILIPMYWFKTMLFGRDISRF